MDLGAAAAIKESGKNIALVTSGGGEQMACDNVEKGVFQEEVEYNVMQQGRDLVNMVTMVLEDGQHIGGLAVVLVGDAAIFEKLEQGTIRPCDKISICPGAQNEERQADGQPL